MECKEGTTRKTLTFVKAIYIETSWNVKTCMFLSGSDTGRDLIETSWNVKLVVYIF